MSLAPATVLPSLVFRGTTRRFEAPSCVLKPDDLRRIYRLLEQKAAEASDRQVATLTLQPGQTPSQLSELQSAVRVALALVVKVQTETGWINATTVGLLSDDQFPEGVQRIEFDSCFLYRTRFNNLVPNNSFYLVLDFSRPPVLDLGNPPSQNVSYANVNGLDQTWANAVYEELVSFFRPRVSKRGWLHFARSYDALVIPIGFPLSFDVVFHLDKLAKAHLLLPEALSVAMDVYVVLVSLFLFRITFNYARWTFPKVEIDAPRQHIAVRHRVAIATLAMIVVGALVKAGLKLVGVG